MNKANQTKWWVTDIKGIKMIKDETMSIGKVWLKRSVKCNQNENNTKNSETIDFKLVMEILTKILERYRPRKANPKQLYPNHKKTKGYKDEWTQSENITILVSILQLLITTLFCSKNLYIINRYSSFPFESQNDFNQLVEHMNSSFCFFCSVSLTTIYYQHVLGEHHVLCSNHNLMPNSDVGISVCLSIISPVLVHLSHLYYKFICGIVNLHTKNLKICVTLYQTITIQKHIKT